MYRWIQITVKESEKRVQQGDADRGTRFGGHLSVRIEMDTTLIIFGHDESIFKQYHTAWVAPDGTTVLVPKDDGQGLMISAFQSREFGFGMEIC
jgi:hypothetical protein